MYFILLEQAARLNDVEPLKYQASLAENRGELSLARQLWVRVWAASRGDWDAVDAIERIALRRRGNFEPIISSEPVRESSSGERSVNSEPVQKSLFTQREEQHQQNLAQYQQKLQQYEQKLIKTVEAGNSLDSYQVRQQLRQLQHDLRLKDTDLAAIEARVVASRRPVTPPPPIPQPSPAQPLQTTPGRINRKQFLIWAGLGSAGFVTAVLGTEIFKGQSPTPISTNQPTDKKPQEVTEDKPQPTFPISAENGGVTFSVQSARLFNGSLLLKVKMHNKGSKPVRFLYSFLDVTDDKGRTLSASVDGLPAELPANGPIFSGTVSIPTALLDDVKRISLALTDYPAQKLRLEVSNIPVKK